MLKQYSDISNVFKRYWRVYGGFQALIRSPYLHVSILITLMLFNTWLSAEWWITVISVIPCLVGFTLGGYAIIVTLGNDEFKDFIYTVDEGDEASYILDVGATFVNFILLQVVSLLMALAAKGFYFEASTIMDNIGNITNIDIIRILTYVRPLFWFVGELVFIYALVTTIAAAIAVFRLNWLYQQYVNTKSSAPRLKCPHCAEEVRQEANVCRYCGRDIKVKP